MNYRPHASHDGHFSENHADNTFKGQIPSHLLSPDSEHVREILEQLDDVIFQAIQGDDFAMEQAQLLWPEVLKQIGWELIEESREQYLRYANEITRHLELDEIRRPERSIAALEIIDLLTCDQ